MAIIFRCLCGKKMQARDELAGRLIQCPICCYLFTIPGEGPGNFVRFTCVCGLKLKAYSFDVGEDVECPGCGLEQTIPGAAPKVAEPMAVTQSDSGRLLAQTHAREVATAAPAMQPLPGFIPAPARKSSPYLSAYPMSNDTMFVQHSAAWKDPRARGLNEKPPPERFVRSRWIPLLVFGAIAVLFAGWALGSQKAERYAEAAPQIGALDLIPTDTVGFVTFQFADLWSAPPGQRLESAIAMARKHVSELNWQDDDIERVTLIWLPPEPSPPAAEKEPIKKAAGREELVEALEGANLGEFVRNPNAVQKKADLQKKDANQKKGGGKNKEDKKAQPKPAGKFAVRNNYCVVIQARDPIPHDNVGPKLLKDGRVATFHKRVYFRTPKGDRAIYPASDRTLVMSTVIGIEHFLRLQLWTGDQHPISEALALARKHAVVAAFNLKEHSWAATEQNGKALMEPGLLSAILAVDEDRSASKRVVSGELRMQFADSAQAEAAKKKKDTDLQLAFSEASGGFYESALVGNSVEIGLRAENASVSRVDQFWTPIANIVEKNLNLVPR